MAPKRLSETEHALSPKTPKLHHHQSAAWNKAFEVTELLEKVLLGVDMKTLLLLQRVSKQWRATIASSTKIQKKLFFIQPTLDEVIEMGLVNDYSQILTAGPADLDDAALLNPLLLDIQDAQWCDNEERPEARIHPSIAADKMNSELGSWQRMYVRTKPLCKDYWMLNFEMTAEVVTVVSQAVESDGLSPGERTPRSRHEFVWGTRPMRSIMKMVEARFLREFGVTFNWASAVMDLWPMAMRYRIWRKMRDLALLEGVDRWFFVSIWNEELHCPPEEVAIDKALEQLKQAADGKIVGQQGGDYENGCGSVERVEGKSSVISGTRNGDCD